MAIDVDGITLATLIDLEDHGVAMTDITAITALDMSTGQLPPARVLAGVALIAARAKDPAATWDDMLTTDLSNIVTMLGDDDGDGDDSPEG